MKKTKKSIENDNHFCTTTLNNFKNHGKSKKFHHECNSTPMNIWFVLNEKYSPPGDFPPRFH